MERDDWREFRTNTVYEEGQWNMSEITWMVIMRRHTVAYSK